MIRDEDLKRATDYSEGQKEAAYSVLGEISNLLSSFSDNTRIIGGWVPTLLYPNSEHIGSIDVDVLLNQLQIPFLLLQLYYQVNQEHRYDDEPRAQGRSSRHYHRHYRQ